MAKFLGRELLEDLQEIRCQTDISDEEYYDLLMIAYRFRLKLTISDEELAEIIKTALEFYSDPKDEEYYNKMRNLSNDFANTSANDYEANFLKIMEEYRQMEKEVKKAIPASFYRALVSLGYVKEKRGEPLTEGLSEEEFNEDMEKKFKRDVERQLESIDLIRPKDILIRASKKTFNNIDMIALDFYWYESFLGNIKVSSDNEIRWLIDQNTYKQNINYIKGILRYIDFGQPHERWRRLNYFINHSGMIVNDEVQQNSVSKEDFVVGEDGYVVDRNRRVF